jgi:hypothetical protein
MNGAGVFQSFVAKRADGFAGGSRRVKLRERKSTQLKPKHHMSILWVEVLE